MALIDKYVPPMARLMVILQLLPIEQLRLVLLFAKFLLEIEDWSEPGGRRNPQNVSEP